MGAVIRCDPIDSDWQTLGVGRYRGVVPEGIKASSNPWGPDQLSFQVKTVEPGSLRPDLLPNTPVELEVDGMLVWAGRIKQRPSTEQDHSVSCEGWQYHLDDDLLNRVYVHTRLGDYRDQRTFLGASLPNFHVAPQVSNDSGSIVIGWAQGDVVAVGSAVGVTLDLGPDSTAKRVVMDWDSTNNEGNITAYCRCSDGESPLPAFTFDDFFSFTLGSGASGTTAGTAATARRYVHVFLYRTAGSGASAADQHLRIKAVKVFRSTAYESGNASVLKADSVVKDALALAPLLNQSTDLITAGTFSIPEYLTGGYLSPRQIIEAINAYENFRTKIGGADLKSLVVDAKPSTPQYEVGEWSGSQFADASVAGDDIYDKVVVTGTGPDGGRIVSKRTQTGTLVDRNGFHRAKELPVSSALTQAVADRFGDLWLTEHKTASFSGKLSASSGIRRLSGGASVPPYELLLAAGEKIRFAHRLDPDTGAWGRDGVIAGVRYKHDDRSVEVDIDDRRDHFETVLNRYGVLVDQFS